MKRTGPMTGPAWATPWSALAAVTLTLAAPGPASAQARRSPIFESALSAPGRPLRGFVDLHTHPMAHLGFGGHVLHGAPDVDVLMAPGTIYDPSGQGTSGATCNGSMRRAASIAEALGTSYSTHRGHDFLKNKCGNHVRQIVLGEMAKSHGIRSFQVERPVGYPTFAHFPAHNDILHQQMWVDWIRRAKEGGLRVMVALAVNSRTLAHGVEANPPIDDRESGNLQIAELVRFVGKHDTWMEIARSSSDLRRIVEKNKLAVIVGVELDDIGNFVWNKTAPTEAQIRAEIRRLHGLGVRYVFPVHLTDNLFGGTAAYEDEVARANRFQTGKWWDLECSRGEGITKRIRSGNDLFKLMKLGDAGGHIPLPSCQPGEGHKNRLGLLPMGRVGINEMMKLGMVIDIDHMSQRMVSDVLAFTRSTPGGAYPLVSGHNGLRGSSGNENGRTNDQYMEIAARGGLAGVGFGGSDARSFLRNAAAVAAIAPGGKPLQITLGSDINGMVVLPRSPECQAPRDQVVTVPGDAWSHPPAQLRCTGGEIDVRSARIGCLDIQTSGNLTGIVGRACNARTSCSYKAPSPDEYSRAGVRAATRMFCTQAMEIVYRCVDPAAKACVDYSRFPKAQMGGRSWDYNEEGVVHIGLFPDFLKHIEALPGGEQLVDRLYNGAEGFAQMWTRAEAVGRSVP
ncbi:membrane dipeptidase [Sorangium sp. So ce385]|uniref:membrane dipeptidase n=1 Tax=Sorangium sp. So ce385 TaxID=3133308 RepID=UPI003F5CB354